MLFYWHPNTEIAQCQGYAGVHIQIGTLAFGVLPKGWKDKGGPHLFVGLFTPRRVTGKWSMFGLKRKALVGSAHWYPKGGPNSKEWRERKARCPA